MPSRLTVEHQRGSPVVVGYHALVALMVVNLLMKGYYLLMVGYLGFLLIVNLDALMVVNLLMVVYLGVLVVAQVDLRLVDVRLSLLTVDCRYQYYLQLDRLAFRLAYCHLLVHCSHPHCPIVHYSLAHYLAYPLVGYLVRLSPLALVGYFGYPPVVCLLRLSPLALVRYLDFPLVGYLLVYLVR